MLTVGEILQKERIKKNLTVQDIEKKIRIRAKFLSAVEKNDWGQFSSNVYISGIIRNYANFLDLDPDKALAFFRREYEKKEDSSNFKRKISKGLLSSERRSSTVVGLTIVGILFFSYFGYQIFRFIKPPSLTITEPIETVFKRVDKVTVVGKTEKESVITIFGSRIFQDENGVFQYDYPLKVGENKLTIKVQGANGKSTIVEKEYVLDP